MDARSAERVKVYQWQTPWDSEHHEGDAEAFRAAIKEASDKDIEAGNLSFPVYGNALMESMTAEMQPMPTADDKDTMDARSVEILEQLKAEVMFPWDRRGNRDGGYNFRPQAPRGTGMALEDYTLARVEYDARYAEYCAAPNINRQLWHGLVDELSALIPEYPGTGELWRLYHKIDTYTVKRERAALLDAMLADD